MMTAEWAAAPAPLAQTDRAPSALVQLMAEEDPDCPEQDATVNMLKIMLSLSG